MVTKKSAQAPNEPDSQLASFHRKTARILRVVSERSSFCVLRSLPRLRPALPPFSSHCQALPAWFDIRGLAEWLRRILSSAFRQFYASGGGFFSDSLGLVAAPNPDSRDFSSSNERQNRHRPADDSRSTPFSFSSATLHRKCGDSSSARQAWRSCIDLRALAQPWHRITNRTLSTRSAGYRAKRP